MKTTQRRRILAGALAGAVMGVASGSASFAADTPPPKDVIPMEQAQATAIKTSPGAIKSSELEQENGTWVYSFDIVGKDGNLHDVEIDAKSGKVLKNEKQSAAEKAKEEIF